MAATAAYANGYYTQEQIAKTIYRSIMKMLHPDMNPTKKPTSYEMNLLYKANDYYAAKNYSALEEVYNTIMNPQPKKATVAKTDCSSLIEFFRAKGLEVIDKRSKGGCLWVVGTPSEIDTIVKQACKMFHAGGNYAMNGGRASGYRTAWFTKCSR